MHITKQHSKGIPRKLNTLSTLLIKIKTQPLMKNSHENKSNKNAEK